MLTSLAAFVVGVLTVPLYAILIAGAITGFWIFSVSNEKKIWAFINMAVLVIVLAIAFQFNPLLYAISHPFVSVGAVVAYAVIGAAWGYFGKWRLFLFKIKNSLIGKAEEWAATDTRSTFESYCKELLEKDGILGYRQHWPIRIKEHIGRITMWMMYWPASMFWTILGDLVQTLYTRFVIYISASMQRMATAQDNEFLAEAQLRKDESNKN